MTSPKATPRRRIVNPDHNTYRSCRPWQIVIARERELPVVRISIKRNTNRTLCIIPVAISRCIP
jgi:hypothetical protein